MPCGRTLDQCIKRVAGVGAIKRPFAEPRVIWIDESTLGLLELARSSTLLPGAAGCPFIKMPASAVVQGEVTLAPSDRLINLAERPQKREFAVVLIIDRLGLVLRPADHRGELAHASAIDLGEVHVLRLLRSSPVSCATKAWKSVSGSVR